MEEHQHPRKHLLSITLDERVNSNHISLYVALYLTWLSNKCVAPFKIRRRGIMDLCKIKSRATYHKIIKDLIQWNHILYHSSYHPLEGSSVSLICNENIYRVKDPILSIRTNFETMPASVVTPEDLKAFKEELIQELAKLIAQNNNHASTKKWLKSNEVRRMLLISPGTLQNLRMNGTLPFTKIGGVIFYDYQDIEKMLAKHSHNKGSIIK